MTEQESVTFFVQQAEEAYAMMYEATSSSSATAHYSTAKEALYSAIGIAQKLGDQKQTELLDKRLSEIKAVFRSQFS